MYKLASKSSVIRTSDGAVIPFDNANRDYQEYLEWISSGGVPLDSLDDVKGRQIANINAACASAIVSGFTSSALGAAHHYTATLEDQANLTSLVLLGVDDSFKCTDAAGVKTSLSHTIAQLKVVLADGGAEKKRHLAKCAMLKDQIAAAADVAAVEAIVW